MERMSKLYVEALVVTILRDRRVEIQLVSQILKLLRVILLLACAIESHDELLDADRVLLIIIEVEHELRLLEIDADDHLGIVFCLENCLEYLVLVDVHCLVPADT